MYLYFLCAFSSANLAVSAPVAAMIVALPEPEPEAAAEVLPEPEPEPEAALLPASLAEAEEAEDLKCELDSYDTSSNLIGSYQLLTSLTS